MSIHMGRISEDHVKNLEATGNYLKRVVRRWIIAKQAAQRKRCG